MKKIVYLSTSCNLQGVTFFSSWSLVCQDTKRAIRIYEGLNDKKGEATRVQQTLHPYLLEMTYPFNFLRLVFRPPVLASFEKAWTTGSFFFGMRSLLRVRVRFPLLLNRSFSRRAWPGSIIALVSPRWETLMRSRGLLRDDTVTPGVGYNC